MLDSVIKRLASTLEALSPQNDAQNVNIIQTRYQRKRFW